MRTVLALVSACSVLLAACSGSSGEAASPHLRASAPATSVAGATASNAAPASSWPEYHGDPGHSGYSATMPAVHHAKLAANLKLNGEVYASPILVGSHIIVATENDVVYSLDAQHRQAWKVTLGSPSPSEERQCGDITPLGITGTPIYDRTHDSVYVVAEMAGNVRHTLFALNPTTGAVRWKRSVDLPGVSAKDMQQRGALAITHGKVWVSYGAQAGDCGNYKGRVVGVPLTGHGASVSYTPPTKRGGGIWNAAGPTVGPAGDLLVVSANGAAFPGDAYDHTNTVLRVNGAGHLVDSFAPKNWAMFNQQDVGLGSQGVALVGSPGSGNQWAVVGGKSDEVWVLDRTQLGGIAGEHSVAKIAPVYGGAAVRASTVYLPCTDGLRAVRVTSSGHLHVLWHVSSAIQGSPVIGGGRVWALDASNGVLYGLDPSTGKTREKVTVGETSRFATPAIDGRDVLVPTLTGLAVVHTT